MKSEIKRLTHIAAAAFFALALLAVIALQGKVSRAADTANITAVVQAAQTLITNGRVVAGIPFQVDHVSIINDVYAIAEWSWGEGSGQVILINKGSASSPSWSRIGAGGGRIDSAGLRSTYNVQPPYNVPLASNVLNCSASNLQPIVPGMSSTGTACYQFVPTPAPSPTEHPCHCCNLVTNAQRQAARCPLIATPKPKPT